jgi:hypothetical protein
MNKNDEFMGCASRQVVWSGIVFCVTMFVLGLLTAACL